MRVLAALTVVMGLMLVIGLGIVAVTILHRMSAPKPAPANAAATGRGHAALPLPPGGRLMSMTAVGDRLALHIGVPNGSEMLILLDPATGAVLETIDLVPQPPAVSP